MNNGGPILLIYSFIKTKERKENSMCGADVDEWVP